MAGVGIKTAGKLDLYSGLPCECPVCLKKKTKNEAKQ